MQGKMFVKSIAFTLELCWIYTYLESSSGWHCSTMSSSESLKMKILH